MPAYRPENPRTASANPPNPIFYSQSTDCQQLAPNNVTPSLGARELFASQIGLNSNFAPDPTLWRRTADIDRRSGITGHQTPGPRQPAFPFVLGRLAHNGRLRGG